ncbi:MAG: ArsB/NhaD family transporter [Candidatus Thermoplasmatota archaeon]|jgi:Na+/H+ antiporter NhaD/arsenite permease-like protein|nr:ArsB/NhaD family transporter [Candidatus Thermoplasmatota archaeon]|tara:strand:- start:4228 stop:5694 length:1467 start_codon:yes stop_codon:yes gene_type:complete
MSTDATSSYVADTGSIEAILILLVFLIAFALILGEIVDRVLAAWGGAVGMLLIGTYYNSLTWCTGGGHGEAGAVCENNLFNAIDFNVIGLLLGMMIFAGMLEISGFFEFVAIKATKLSGGDPWKLVFYLGTFTTVISVFIDNVTALILIAPVTLKICSKIEISPIPPLIALAIFSNTGGVATLVGDPPNVLIASYASARGLGFGFMSFIYHLTPLAIVAWGATLWFMHRHFKKWREVKPQNVDEVTSEDEWAAVKNDTLMYRTLGALAVTVVMFAAVELLHLDLEISAVSLGGAGIAMSISMLGVPEEKRMDIHEVVHKVEWGALLFFAGLFVMVGGLEAMGYLEAIANMIFDGFGPDGSVHNSPVVLVIVLIWVSAIASAIVDNIPFCAAMLPVILEIGELSKDPITGVAEVDIIPLYWALAIGCGFGGNATPIGSSANVMTIAISERGGHKISTKEWLGVGVPVMIITCTIGSIVVALFYDHFLTA